MPEPNRNFGRSTIRTIAVEKLVACAIGVCGAAWAASEASYAEDRFDTPPVARATRPDRPKQAVRRTARASRRTRSDRLFENLGSPVVRPTLPISIVTRDQQGGHVAWASLESPDQLGLLGVRVDDGAIVWRDLSPYGRAHIQMTRAGDGNIYLYCGRPGRFLQLDRNTHRLSDLGVPDKQATYWLGRAVGRDGRFYVGTYPRANLVFVDPSTGAIGDLGRLPDDARQAYLLHPVVSDDNVAYCPVGLHHMELWTLDMATGIKRQILTDPLTKLRGCPEVWIGDDGHVYGRAGSTRFRCRPDGIERHQTAPRRGSPAQNQMDGQTATQIDAQGRLVLMDAESRGKEKQYIPTSFDGVGVSIFSVGCQRDGWIYGGTFSPATLFRCHHGSGRLENLGRVTGGRTQIYDALCHQDGIYLTSYGGGCIDCYAPDAAGGTGEHVHRLARLSSPHEQERPIQIVQAGDERLYTGTVPIKGVLGGALVRVDPGSGEVDVWRNVIPEQSICYLAPIEGQQLFGTSSVQGGSSAIPTQQEACVFIWDLAREEVVHRARPVPGTRRYGSVVTARTGNVYGIAGNRYYVFDPVNREVVARGPLPVRRIVFPGLCANPLGNEGEVVGLGDDAVFAIHPGDHSCRVVVRHPSIRQARGVFLTRDGTLYYGSGDDLWRCRVSDAATADDQNEPPGKGSSSDAVDETGRGASAGTARPRAGEVFMPRVCGLRSGDIRIGS